jgi:DNA invertase Pin-like site-specific DNA recombinase
VTETKKLWAIYTRESSEGQLEGKPYDSHASQEDILRRHVRDADGEVFKVYSDTATGTKYENRPAFMQLLLDAEAGKVQYAVAYDVDRWCRSVEIHALMLGHTKKTGVNPPPSISRTARKEG